ncbi:hypothetical protein [Carnobacterium maltaromaticum]|uniref:hypothetical protein n=1 Tax=Carnobacterium maltaromaticum TaxID=2751 RepID=UPI00295EB3B7|nr:hypothetical protein [Carnobacterium maltaromaticum]
MISSEQKYEKRMEYYFKKLSELVKHTNDWPAARIKKRSRRLKNYKEAAEARRAIKK